jgi:hypothetical protein
MIAAKIKLIAFLAGAGALFLCGWHVNGLRWESKLSDALIEKEAAIRLECETAQKTTAEVSNGYQAKIRDINNRHSVELERVRATVQCARVTGAPGGRDAAAPGGGFHSAVDVPAEQLLEMASIADRQTAQLIACQEFIRAERR